ncbi:cholesterol 7-desaturase nvd-like isoform X1 [Ornithodoros turicata]|uniref:cholesterol 7-desaturase nvd-like isoform X1 n=1 Tax=Ornithodoros turicata TaxID=34597 RepID=UPI0031391616
MLIDHFPSAPSYRPPGAGHMDLVSFYVADMYNSSHCLLGFLLLPFSHLVLVHGVLLVALLLIVWLLCCPRRCERKSRKEHARLKRPKTELLPPFPNGWIPILESSELRVQQIEPIDVLGEHLVAFRTADGKAHVTDAYCPHLGANLGVKGRVVGNCVECPFHGWRYDATDGACVHVPYSDAVPSFVRLRTWQTTESMGLIFVWYHAEGTPPSWELPDIPEITSGEFVQRDRACHIARCQVQDVAENGADVGHFNYLHRPSGVLSPNIYASHLDTNSWWSKLTYHRWQTSWSSKEHLAFVKMHMQISLLGYWPKWLHTETDALQAGPALFILTERSRFGKCVVIHSLTPMASLKVKIVHRIYAPRQMLKLVWLNHFSMTVAMLERDVAIWNDKIFLKNPALVKEDRPIAEYRKWFSQFYSENSQSVEDVREKTLDW